jgi:hypothetical protein
MSELQDAIEQCNTAMFKALREQWWVFVLLAFVLGGLVYVVERNNEFSAAREECKAFCLDRAASTQSKYEWYEYVSGKCYCMIGYQVVKR